MNQKLARLWATKNGDDEWWSSFVTSPLAIAANYFAVDFKWLTPDRITLLSFVVAIIATVFIVLGGVVNFVIAAILVHASHVLDCMDGQMARYRRTPSSLGSYVDRLTDQIQVTLWFGAVGYAAHLQTHDIMPLILAFIGVSFYSLRGYAKYVAIHTEMSRDCTYLSKVETAKTTPNAAGPGFGFAANLRWFLTEQKKVLAFNEGVFIFMLSLALVLDILTPMLWVFAISQLYYGFYRSWQHGRQIGHEHKLSVEK